MQNYVVKNIFMGTTRKEIEQRFNEQLSKVIAAVQEKDLQQLSKAI